MNRRELLARFGQTLLAAASVPILIKCTGGKTYLWTSSTVNQTHTHTYTLTMDNLTNPPSAGLSTNTSSEPGHSHTVSLTLAQLTSISQGASIQTSTGVTQGHQHQFTLSTALAVVS